MTWLCCSAILLGSCLLFLVQPMCAKMLLPMLGGTPAAWNTCLVFFQAGLLAGYAYAHAVPRWLGARGHALLHVALLVGTFFMLPIQLPDDVPPGWHPIAWLLASLTLAVGLPFVLLAAGAPLLQRWFVTRQPAAPGDPYFLYAASNIGSFLGLALFPFVLEPRWPLTEQSEIWTGGFLVLIALLALCAPLRRRVTQHGMDTASSHDPATGWKTRCRWLSLSLIPSSLLLSVTTHLTTDVAAIPLLWVIPMALYLLTYTLVFARIRTIPHAVVLHWLPLAAIVLAIVMLAEATEPMLLVMGLHLACFFWMALACHGELSRTRPAAVHLTDFYLCLAAGGVLGGAFSALAAPLIFSGLYEYPLMIVLACLVAPTASARVRDWLVAGAIGGVTATLVFLFQADGLVPLPPGPISVAAMFALPLIVCFAMKDRPARFALGMGALFLASASYHGMHGPSAFRERSWFGIHRVTQKDGFMQLIHGNTVHGQQSLDPQRRRLPLAYYAQDGPIGDVFRAYRDDPRLKSVGVVGLGTGSLAAYSLAGDRWTFFEIDPAVKHIATDAKLFTYLADAQGKMAVEMGDARLSLRKSDQQFGLLVIDAFGSDAIPVHLLTREALGVYFSKLAPGGLLAAHISNRYVDLEPVLANLAADAKPPRVAYIKRFQADVAQKAAGVLPSEWLIMAANDSDLQPLRKVAAWHSARRRPELPIWTDDRSDVFQVFRWHDDK